MEKSRIFINPFLKNLSDQEKLQFVEESYLRFRYAILALPSSGLMQALKSSEAIKNEDILTRVNFLEKIINLMNTCIDRNLENPADKVINIICRALDKCLTIEDLTKYVENYPNANSYEVTSSQPDTSPDSEEEEDNNPYVANYGSTQELSVCNTKPLWEPFYGDLNITEDPNSMTDPADLNGRNVKDNIIVSSVAGFKYLTDENNVPHEFSDKPQEQNDFIFKPNAIEGAVFIEPARQVMKPLMGSPDSAFHRYVNDNMSATFNISVDNPKEPPMTAEDEEVCKIFEAIGVLNKAAKIVNGETSNINDVKPAAGGTNNDEIDPANNVVTEVLKNIPINGVKNGTVITKISVEQNVTSSKEDSDGEDTEKRHASAVRVASVVHKKAQTIPNPPIPPGAVENKHGHKQGDKHSTSGKSNKTGKNHQTGNGRIQSKTENVRIQPKTGNGRIQSKTESGPIISKTENVRIQPKTGNGRIQSNIENVRIQPKTGNGRIQSKTGNGRIQPKTENGRIQPKTCSNTNAHETIRNSRHNRDYKDTHTRRNSVKNRVVKYEETAQRKNVLKDHKSDTSNVNQSKYATGHNPAGLNVNPKKCTKINAYKDEVPITVPGKQSKTREYKVSDEFHELVAPKKVDGVNHTLGEISSEPLIGHAEGGVGHAEGGVVNTAIPRTSAFKKLKRRITSLFKRRSSTPGFDSDR